MLLHAERRHFAMQKHTFYRNIDNNLQQHSKAQCGQLFSVIFHQLENNIIKIKAKKFFDKLITRHIAV